MLLHLLPLLSCVLSELVVQEGDIVTAELLLREGELVESRQEPLTYTGHVCPGLEVEVRELRYWVGGREERLSVRMNVAAELSLSYAFSDSGQWVERTLSIMNHFTCLEAEDGELLEYLQDVVIPPPAQLQYDTEYLEPFNSVGKSFSQYGQDMFLDRVVFKKSLRNGFFIEAGAHDWVKDSNTLWLEMERGWTGILVEPMNWERRVLPRRNVWGFPLCLGIQTKPHFARFGPQGDKRMGGLVQETSYKDQKLQCFPLFSLLSAVGNRTVNLLSLDIEGTELQVLETLPWDRLDIELVLVETQHIDRKGVFDFMREKGYSHIATIYIDDLFVRDDLREKYQLDKTALDAWREEFSAEAIQRSFAKFAERYYAQMIGHKEEL